MDSSRFIPRWIHPDELPGERWIGNYRMSYYRDWIEYKTKRMGKQACTASSRPCLEIGDPEEQLYPVFVSTEELNTLQEV